MRIDILNMHELLVHLSRKNIGELNVSPGIYNEHETTSMKQMVMLVIKKKRITCGRNCNERKKKLKTSYKKNRRVCVYVKEVCHACVGMCVHLLMYERESSKVKEVVAPRRQRSFLRATESASKS